MSQSIERIAPYQMALILFMTIIGDSIYFLPSFAAAQSGRDAWISFILATIAGLAMIFLLVQLLARHPGKDVVAISEEVAGKWVGKLLIFWFWLHSFLINSYIAREFSEFLTTTLMPETPILVFIAVLLATAGLAVFCGVEVVAKVTEFTLPIYLIGLVTINLFAMRDFNILELTPVLEKGWQPVIYAALPLFVWIGNTAYIAFIPLQAKELKQVRAWLLGAGALAGAFMVATVIVAVGVFGSKQTAMMEFPFFHLGAQVLILGVLERLDPIVMTIWILGDFIAQVFFFYIACYSTARLFGLQDYRPLVLPLILLFSGLAITQFESTMDIHAVGGKYYPIFAFTAEAGVPLVLLALSYLRSDRTGNNPS